MEAYNQHLQVLHLPVSISSSLIDASQIFANEILRIKILQLACSPQKPHKLHTLKIWTHTILSVDL